MRFFPKIPLTDRCEGGTRIQTFSKFSPQSSPLLRGLLDQETEGRQTLSSFLPLRLMWALGDLSVLPGLMQTAVPGLANNFAIYQKG